MDAEQTPDPQSLFVAARATADADPVEAGTTPVELPDYANLFSHSDK
ncbi:hypothetical protein [Skermania sp. ID1734]|nr:hypothetical protein [Skermania sp. ID1734]